MGPAFLPTHRARRQKQKRMNSTETETRQIDTRLVYGFLDAGKTTYIRENVLSDVFWKYGSTLILCFEQGEEEYDAESLAQKKASVAYYDGGDIARFCLDAIEKYQPDRIYVEMNAMTADLKEALPACLKKTFAVTLIDWYTMALYYTNFMQMMKQMVTDSQQVVFRGCPSADLLAPYSQAFRLMNPKASYLRRDPMGYHEKAFEMFLPYSLEDTEIVIGEERFLPFWLDALDHPEHYEGKEIVFKDPVEMRRTGENGAWACGRVVMTCCMQDLQFMAFDLELSREDAAEDREGWMTGRAAATVVTGEFGRRKLRLQMKARRYMAPPKEMVLDGRHA